MFPLNITFVDTVLLVDSIQVSLSFILSMDKNNVLFKEKNVDILLYDISSLANLQSFIRLSCKTRKFNFLLHFY